VAAGGEQLLNVSFEVVLFVVINAGWQREHGVERIRPKKRRHGYASAEGSRVQVRKLLRAYFEQVAAAKRMD
jgi:hypothetical protein